MGRNYLSIPTALLKFGNGMMTSSVEKISALLAFCVGNSPVIGEFSAQRPVARKFYILFDMPRNKQLSKQA